MKLSLLQKGLVAHYPLDKESLQSATTFANKTPYENVGTSANTPVFTADRMGQGDRAMSFNGTSDWIDFGTYIPDANTISFWLRIPVANNGGIIYAGTDTFQSLYWDWALYMFNSVLYPRGREGQGGTSFSYTLNQWMHIVMIRNDGGVFKVYRDNVEVISDASLSGSTETAGRYLRIAKADTTFWNGSIADVRLYNRVLTAAEITQLYEQYRPKFIVGI